MQARVEYLHRSEFCVLEEACSRSQQSEKHSQWDLGLSAAYQQWNLTAYVDNLTDERSAYPTLGSPSDWLTEDYLSPPREIGLELVYQLR